MAINSLSESTFVDIFGSEGEMTKPEEVIIPKTGFTGMETQELDLFGNPVEKVEEKVENIPTGEVEKVEEKVEETPILDEGDDADKGKPGRKPKYDFSDISGYFQDRIKSGKFVAIEQDGEDGKPVQFIPQTPEDFDEVIDIQVNYKLEQERQQLKEQVYNSQSPAWKATLQYAELVDNPAEMIPFLQGVQNIQSVANIKEDEIEGAEAIVRMNLESTGQSKALIDTQIEALKTTDKLLDAAKELKPAMIQAEQQRLGRLQQQKLLEQQNYQRQVEEIHNGAVKVIESPIFGKQTLKKEEKAAVYDLIGAPDPESGGYGIYTEIDKLFESKNFEKLRKIALLLANEDSLTNYISASAAQKTATGLERKLRAATEARGATGNDGSTVEQNRPVVRRSQFKGFGR
jgi:hypothetical protein